MSSNTLITHRARRPSLRCRLRSSLTRSACWDASEIRGSPETRFCGHFESKDELAAVACARAFADGAERWQGRVSAGKSLADAKRRLLQGYLSSHPRDDDSQICPMVGFGADVAREPDNAAVRHRYAEGFESLSRILIDVQPGKTKATRRRQGLAELTSLVGTIVLSRALAGEPVGEEIVNATRGALAVK